MAELNDKAKKIFALKYSTRKTKQWLGACREIADFIAEGERPYGKTEEEIKVVADKYYDMLSDLFSLPGGRIIANAGTGIKNLANCFVIGIKDSRQSIYQALKDAAEIFAMGGGVGYSFSGIREEGADINSTGGQASGPLSFMTLFDQTGEVIQQASRRGAQLGSLFISHPDIEKFIGFKSTLNSRNTRLVDEYDRNLRAVSGTLKSTKYEKILEKTLLDDQLTHFNISVLLTDDFMQAVVDDKEWNLISPKTHLPVKTLKARDLLYLMAKQAHASGDPGELFFNRINVDNIVPYMGDITATNPCFSYNSMLLTENGYVEIGSLDGQKLNLVDAEGNVQQGRVFKSGNKNTIKLRLSNKQEIICTPNHILKTEDGDYEALNTKGKKLIPYLQYKSLDNKYILYGFIQGDGDLGRLKSDTHKGVEVNIGKDDSDINKLLKGHTYTSGERKVYLQDVKDELIDLDFSSNALPERLFPKSYSTWDINKKASFLRGCYSANGSTITSTRIAYKATCKEFILQLQATLKNDFGISSYITTNKSHDVEFSNGVYTIKESYDLNISKFEDKVKFSNEINFYQDYKVQKLNTLIVNCLPYVRSIKENGNVDVYDFSLPKLHWGVVNGFVVHNCGEVPLLEGESCILASINLHQIYNKKNKCIDWDLLKNLTKTQTRFLEDVTEITVAPLEYIDEMTKGLRRLGGGVMGLADLLVELDIPYDSEEAVELSRKLSWFISFHSWETSFELAKERGHFKFYDKDKVDLYVVEKTLYNNPYQKSEIPIEELHSIGVRNVAVNSLAPTGSIALLGGVNSGIEPFFSLAYKRNITEGVGNTAKDSIFEINPALEGKLKDAEYSKEEITEIIAYSVDHGTIKNCPLVSKELQNIFKTANEIHWKDHVNVQAAWQEYVSNAISKTINVPEKATVNDIFDIYIYMWQMGLKGGTIYRNNSKSFQILEKIDAN